MRMQSELTESMQSDPNREKDDLLNALLSRREKVVTELNQLNALIATYQNESLKVEVKSTPQLKLQIKTKQPRVRGVLAAARKAIDQLTGPFDKNQLLAKLVEIDEEFAHKKITGANIRNALRLLTQDGVIKVESKATATTCAKYVKTA
jgi:hypothetical protein